MALETGTILNNIYRVVRLLGSGAMGNVYLVERIEDDRRFVVKELIFSKACGIEADTAKEIFFREAEFMVNFNHAGLPKTYGIFTEKELNYLTMDYIEGKTLEDILNSSEKPLSEEKAIKWTAELCEILDYLHNGFKAPVVYRDLKPSNIIITPDDKVKLVDFGIARYYNPDKDTDTFSYGSPGYAAPEQYRGRGQSSPQSDVYGLGVILFQMLTLYDPSVKPFTFPSVKTLNSSVKPGFEDIIRRAIEMEPLKRYISVKDFRDSLLKYTGAGKISSRKSGGAGRTEIYKLAGLFIFSLSIVLLFFNPVNINPVNIRNFDVDAAADISVLIFFSSIITFFLWHIIKLIIDIKNRNIKFSLLSRVMILLTFAGLVIVNFTISYDKNDYLNNSLITIISAFIIWFFIKYIIIYDRINSSDNVRIIFVIIPLIAFCLFMGMSIVDLMVIIILIFVLVLCSRSLFHLIHLFFQWISSGKSRGELIQSFFFPVAILMFFVLIFFMTLPGFLRARAVGQLAACESNIKNIATALEMYSEDNKGYYPPSLEYLLSPTDSVSPGTDYMKTLPLCPSSRLTYNYIVNNNIPTFTLWCNEKNFHRNAGVSDGYPQYAPGQGLIFK
mgnify:CR=1 FL=1